MTKNKGPRPNPPGGQLVTDPVRKNNSSPLSSAFDQQADLGFILSNTLDPICLSFLDNLYKSLAKVSVLLCVNWYCTNFLSNLS